MICKKCGSSSLKDTDKFCSECGARFETDEAVLNNNEEENVIQECPIEKKDKGRVVKKEKNKTKKKKNKIAIILIIMFIIFSGLYACSNIQKEAEMEQERITLQYVIDLSVYEKTMNTLYISSIVYSDNLISAWEKGLSGDINVALKKYMEKEDSKKVEKMITDGLENTKKVYYEYIQPVSIQGGGFDNIPSLLEEIDRTSRAFIELTINPVGSYSSYNSDRTRLHSDFKSAKDRLTDRIDVLKKQYGVTEEMVTERKTELIETTE